jgi:hypothetical protein
MPNTVVVFHHGGFLLVSKFLSCNPASFQLSQLRFSLSLIRFSFLLCLESVLAGGFFVSGFFSISDLLCDGCGFDFVCCGDFLRAQAGRIQIQFHVLLPGNPEVQSRSDVIHKSLAKLIAHWNHS